MSPDSKQIPARFAILIAAIEQELDEIHPADRHSQGWRNRGSFAHKDEEVYKRIKYLLKRHSLLCDGRDWPVNLTRGSAPGQWSAHPVLPGPDAQDYDPMPEALMVSPDKLVSALLDPDRAAAIRAILEGK